MYHGVSFVIAYLKLLWISNENVTFTLIGGDLMRIQKCFFFFVAGWFMFLLSSSNQMAEELRETFPPMPEALEALESDYAVTVHKIEVADWEEDSNYYYVFEPNRKDPTIGFIIYPGGLVDPASYAPAAHALAAKGFLTVMVKMMNDLALGQSAQRANTIINDYHGIDKWIIGGHSLGGVGASSYARDFTENIVGIVFWASYPSYYCVL